MSDLPKYFKQALSNIEPTEDVKNAISAHEEVSKVLKADEDLQALGIAPVLIGSYKRQVSIKRIKDVDVFCRLEDAGPSLLPSEALNLFEEVLSSKENFGSSRVERQDRSMKVNFPDYDLSVDAVPARPKGDNWELPSLPEDAERATWVETNPLLLNELTTAMNKRYDEYYIPVVKLIRQVRYSWLGDHPGGFFFEIMTYWAFDGGLNESDSVAKFFVLALEEVAEKLTEVSKNGLDDATLNGKTISTKSTPKDFEEAISSITEASKLARKALNEEEDCASAVLWRKVLGKTAEGNFAFPLPAYCNSDGSRKSSSSVTPGATKVPAGNDRYA